MTTAVVGCVDHQDQDDQGEKVGTAESAFGGHGEYAPLGLTCEAGKVMVSSSGRDRCTYRLVGQNNVDAQPTFSVKNRPVVESPRSVWECEVTLGAGACNISAQAGECLVGERAGGEKPCTPPALAITAAQINPRDGQKLIVTVTNVDGTTPTSVDEAHALAECRRAYNQATVSERDQIVAQACRDEVASLNAIPRSERLLCCVDSPVKSGDGDSRADAGAPTCTAPKELFVKANDVNLCNYHVEDVAWDPLPSPTIDPSLPFDLFVPSVDDATYLDTDLMTPASGGNPQSHRFVCAPKVSCNLVASRLRCDPFAEPSGRRAECPNGSGESAAATPLGKSFELPDRLVTTYRTEQDITSDAFGRPYERTITVPVQSWEKDWETARTICRDHIYQVIQTKTQEEIRHESWFACKHRADVKSSETKGSLSCCKEPGADAGVKTDGGGSDGGGGASDAGSFPDAQQIQLPSYDSGAAPRDGGAG
jgi:hypothetical protein